ncbi:MAG TPA: hypothetical protein VJT15_04130 [Pyrinomonadaceae bacterium]|nr:hypothetical protein [Pyrinomonadaceae bacterium]
MNTSAQRILDDLCNDESFRGSRLAELAQAGEFSEELRSAIEEKSARQRWGCVCRLVWVAQRFPNHSLVPVLTRLLDAREDDGYLEAVVDALIIMPDGRAVESLKAALDYRVPGDDLAFHFNKKVIMALSAIGSEAAIEGIRRSLTSPEEPIRSFAATSLRSVDQ